MVIIDKLVIFYFSGTGNAKQIATWFLEYAVNSNIDTQLYDISAIDIPDSFSPDALIIIISPIHGFNYPKITLDFIRRFPAGGNKIVLMNTRAGLRIKSLVTPGLTGFAFIVSCIMLKAKGYRIKGQIPFDMPSNWFSLHPALTEKTTRFILDKNQERVAKRAEKIFSGSRDFLSNRDLIQDILITPVSLAYYFAGRYVLAKTFYASNYCTNCKGCIKQCPVKAIKETDNRPYWTLRCESCMKCMSNCPEKAIETGHGLFVISILASIFILSALLTLLPAGYLHSWFTKLLLFTGLFVLLISILYRLQHFLLRSKFWGRFIMLTSLTHYRFWGKSNPKIK